MVVCNTGQSNDTDDDISVSDSLKSYKEKTALSRRIQSYNKVLTDREVTANKRMEMLRESLIQKEMEECTFQPTISNAAHKLKGKEIIEGQQLDDSGSVVSIASSVKVYDRLYAEKDTVPRSIAQDKHEPSSNRGLDECTFIPNVNHTQHSSSSSTTRSGDGSSTAAPDIPPVKQRRQSRMEKDMVNFFGDLELESGNQQVFQPAFPEDNKKKSNKSKPQKEEPVKPPTAPRGYSDSIKR
jgi:hypothetical protein